MKRSIIITGIATALGTVSGVAIANMYVVWKIYAAFGIDLPVTTLFLKVLPWS